MGSTRTSPSDGGGTGGSFKCDYPRCNKTFTRKDHLIRHQANHSTTTFSCPVCGRLFKRLDLLQRHEKRNICGEAGPSSTTPRLNSTTAGKKGSKPTNKRKRSPSSSSSSSESSTGVLSPTQLLSHDLQADKAGLELINGWNRDHDDEESEDWVTNARQMLPPPFGRVPRWDQGVDWAGLMRRSKGSDGARTVRTDVKLSVQTIMRLQAEYSAYASLFENAQTHFSHLFTSLALSFPIIHQLTFDPNSTSNPPHLVALMIVLGAVSSSSTSTPSSPSIDYSVFVRSIRRDLVDRLGSDDLEIEVLQTLILCYIYESHFAPPLPQHNGEKTSGLERSARAGVWWAGVVAHLTRQGIGVREESSTTGSEIGGGGTGEEGEVGWLWKRWVREEERLRLAYNILHLDLHTPLYTHRPPSRPYPFSAYDLPLPSGRALWECQTAEDWLAQYTLSQVRTNGTSPINNVGQDGISGGVMSVMKGLMVSPKDAALVGRLRVDLDHAFAVRAVIMMLVGVGWDCKVYGGQWFVNMLGDEDQGHGKRWRRRIQDALIHLRATWEGATQHIPSCTEIRDMRDLFGISILSVLSDIPTFFGMTASPPPSTALHKGTLWVKTDDAFTCLWQSARYLKQALFADWGMYTAEVIYLSTLVLYTYALTSLPLPIISTPPRSTSEGTHTLLDSILASNARPHLAQEPILDLLACSAEMILKKSYPRSDPAQLEVLRRLIDKNTQKKEGEAAGDIGLLVGSVPASILPVLLDLAGDGRLNGISTGNMTRNETG